jgi:hypothetical protein
MVETVSLRPNHYELLGLTPAASSAEIAQAFAKELSLLPMRPFGSLAQVSLAYETLRDPIKRVAYDASLRPAPKPEPSHPLIGRLESAAYLGGATAKPVVRPAALSSSPVTPRPEPLGEPRTAPSASELLRQSPKPTAREIDPPLVTHRPLHHDALDRFDQSEKASIDWRLPALAGGALMLAVVLGAWTGWEAGNDNEQVQPEAAAMLKTLPGRALPTLDVSPEAPAPIVAEAPPERRTRAPVAAARTARARPPFQIDLPEVDSVEAAQADQAQSEAIATEQAVAEAPAVAPTAAKLPLPKAVIARTIGRIGYACGQVASATAVEGSAGVFTVTCTSGHSYRAAPVRGRYHFRRLGSR